MIVLSLVYLAYFVPRAWVPHDEGMRGQSAERVLLGGLPHVDYGELYTGGLAWAHAAVFKLFGIDVLYLRWLLFLGAAFGQWVAYSIFRRYLPPIQAALASWLALAWSYPNFFAAEASWWLLICALVCVWAFIRYVETEQIRYAAAAGLMAGVAIVIKQTGIYLAIAVLMSLLFESSAGPQRWSQLAGRVTKISFAVAGVALGLVILRTRFFPADLLYLLLPIAACCRLLATSGGPASAKSDRQWIAMLVAALFIAIPLIGLLIPYIANHQLPALINGVLIAPQKRFVFTNMDMDSAAFLLTGVPLVALLIPFPWLSARIDLARALVAAGSWLVAVLLFAGSLRNADAYQAIWQSARAFAALLPMVVCWRLISGQIHDRSQRRILFAMSTMLAWASLVQFPFSAPIYFCYVAPLAIVAAIAATDGVSPNRRMTLAAWSGLLLAFGVVSMNRGYIYNLGQYHEPQTYGASLDLARAHLRVTEKDATKYQHLIGVITEHLGNGQLLAGPDSPEVYFLTGRMNPSGALFDFLAAGATDGEGVADATAWHDTTVIVINHRPPFSPRPTPELAADIRQAFPSGESIGQFEVRWR